jgi:hypothetical protein
MNYGIRLRNAPTDKLSEPRLAHAQLAAVRRRAVDNGRAAGAMRHLTRRSHRITVKYSPCSAPHGEGSLPPIFET